MNNFYREKLEKMRIEWGIREEELEGEVKKLRK
jgi:hypothetical protein